MLLIFISAIFAVFLSSFLQIRIKKIKQKRSSLPIHFIYCFILWSLVFSSALVFSSLNDIQKYFLSIGFIAILFLLINIFYQKNFNAKFHLEYVSKTAMALVAGIGILITIAIAVSILFEAIKFFKVVNIQDFLFGLTWNPQAAMHTEQGVSSPSFGMIPVFLGTILITLIAIFIAVPIGIMSAIYLTFYTKEKFRDYAKPVLEMLAGIPTVVYGYFAVVAIAPFFKIIFTSLGLEITSENALSAGFVMGIMIIPFVLSLTDDALNSVAKDLKDASLALGSTKSEMIKNIAIHSAMPGIIGAVILAVSRAIGETMIVAMAAGLVAKLSFNPLDSVTTATAQIVTLLIGDQEFNSPKTLSAFALALVLFTFTFFLNIIALFVMRRFKSKL
jgi:phosphate transport system permease protein